MNQHNLCRAFILKRTLPWTGLLVEHHHHHHRAGCRNGHSLSALQQIEVPRNAVADVIFPPRRYVREVSPIVARLGKGTAAITRSATLPNVARVLPKGKEARREGEGDRKAICVARNTTQTVGILMQNIRWILLMMCCTHNSS